MGYSPTQPKVAATGVFRLLSQIKVPAKQPARSDLFSVSYPNRDRMGDRVTVDGILKRLPPLQATIHSVIKGAIIRVENDPVFDCSVLTENALFMRY
ncbi:MAG: hypothetical protein HKP58_00635 [Desulfatitalea sp.]|nr:hypothetical protein [Desulfatitalea sp.]NNJ98896.1 hypothetical protein [Desulfatitalea sp.]